MKNSRSNQTADQNELLRLALKQLLGVAYEAENAMTESLNLDLAVGNDSFDDVQELSTTLDKLDSAIEVAERALNA